MQKLLLSIGTKNWGSGSQAFARLLLNCEVRGLYARNPRKNDAVVDRIRQEQAKNQRFQKPQPSGQLEEGLPSGNDALSRNTPN